MVSSRAWAVTRPAYGGLDINRAPGPRDTLGLFFVLKGLPVALTAIVRNSKNSQGAWVVTARKLLVSVDNLLDRGVVCDSPFVTSFVSVLVLTYRKWS